MSDLRREAGMLRCRCPGRGLTVRFRGPLVALILVVLVFLLGPGPLLAADGAAGTNGPDEALPGVALAQGLSEITGVAISPMLGVSVVGAWRYYHAPEAGRDALPWFCQPYAWGIGFVLLSLCFLKDVFGTVSPPLLKKPLDVLELFEDKASALLASAAFVPFVAGHLAQFSSAPAQESLAGVGIGAGLRAMPFAAAIPVPDLWWAAALLLIPPAIAVFLTVWLACHAINVLIVLSPFGFIDAVLKLFKVGLIACVAALAAIHPYLGALFSVGVIIVAAMIAPWSFRLSVFGTLCAHDILFPERAGLRACPDRAHAFLARRTAGVPVRTYGRLSCAPDGTIRFIYRPWIVFPARELPLPGSFIAVSRGMFFPCLLLGSEQAAPLRKAAILLPRYRDREASIASHFSTPVEICDGGVLKGLSAVRAWLTEMLRGGGEAREIGKRGEFAKRGVAERVERQ